GKTAAHKKAETAPTPHPVAVPQPTLSAKNEPPPEVTRTAPPAVTETPQSERPEDVALDKAREAAASFLETLPNYVCKELMTRYQNTSHIVSWQPLDVVSTALVYENGRESYRDISINGKPTKKNIEDLPGAWSTGEFGTVLADIFSPATAADF